MQWRPARPGSVSYTHRDVYKRQVLFSAYRPAKKVGKFTAIQCVKGIGAGTVLKEIQVKDSFIQKIFGCESAIAYKNMKRNKYRCV